MTVEELVEALLELPAKAPVAIALTGCATETFTIDVENGEDGAFVLLNGDEL